jgi:hypothetical protein
MHAISSAHLILVDSRLHTHTSKHELYTLLKSANTKVANDHYWTNQTTYVQNPLMKW